MSLVKPHSKASVVIASDPQSSHCFRRGLLPTIASELHNTSMGANGWHFFRSAGLESQLLCCGLANDLRREELRVTNKRISGVGKDELHDTGERTMATFSFAPIVLAGDVYGGGTEYFPFWQLPLSPFTWIREFIQEEY